ncbi:MAG TPA: sigma 54-interacting transcriptional regulator [Thermoanaerobaculia bacterium]|nr:sigma 54-interacting transcriptional regulator [Thermoanaerobaculia bacterium]
MSPRAAEPSQPASSTGSAIAPAEALAMVDTAFASLGRVVLCTDHSFQVLHASPVLDDLSGPGAAEEAVGRPIEEVLGRDLFAPEAPFRQALEAGERREGWRASLEGPDGALVTLSVTAAPVTPLAGVACNPVVSFVVVLRPAEQEEATASRGPTVFAGLVARSGAMLQLFRLVENLEHSEATVLITGESGTGKELVARAIHLHSPRRNGPFVAVNCAGLPGDLLESELFGHVRGAFTGAVRDRVGRFELADRGTLFLDEIGDLPLPLQAKLLRVLQERTFERVGESHSRASQARVIAATNVDLRQAVASGRFREDLYYRLRVVPIEVPPLRQRREDVEPLARALLARVAARRGRDLRFSPEALRAVLRYPFPGNVRELENALEYAVAVAKGQTVQPEDLPTEILDAQPLLSRGPAAEPAVAEPPAPSPAWSPRPTPREAREAAELRAALEAHRWRREEAARALGISRTTLWRKMRELGLE